jgi:hypothetical protein
VSRRPYLDDFKGGSVFTYNPQKVVWKDSFNEYSPKERQHFREIIENKLAHQIFNSLSELEIISGEMNACQRSQN